MSADRGEHTSEQAGSPRSIRGSEAEEKLRGVLRARRAADGRGAAESGTSVANLIAQGGSGLHPSDDFPAARAAAREHGWQIVELDSSHGTDKPYFLEVCRRAFDLPDWFGRNWDALDDSLTDVDNAPGTLVLWRGAGALEATVRETAAEIFAGRAAQADRGFAPFLVLVGDARSGGRSMNDL